MINGKRHRINVICLSAFLLAAVSLQSADTIGTGFILVINPGSPSSATLMKEWRSPLTRRELNEWGAGLGFIIEDDREPVVDNVAAYVSPRGSTITIGGLGRGVRYRAWIDFVRVRYGSSDPASSLKIYAAAPGAEKRLIESLALRDITGGYRYIDIPVDLTSRGAVELTFTEYSCQPGSWGVWDIIVTNGLELPARGSMPVNDTINLEIIDRIVQ